MTNNASEDEFYGLLPATNLVASEKQVRKLENGEMILVVQDLSKIKTPSFTLGTDGTVSATSREGHASVLLTIRCNDNVIAFPFAMYITFEWFPSCTWTWEIPVALGRIDEKSVPFSTEWISKIRWNELPLRVFIEPKVIEKLDTSEVIAPDGEHFGPAVPLKKHLGESAAHIPNPLAPTVIGPRPTNKRVPRTRRLVQT